ncbi:pheromone-regulated protein PRM3 [Saccharomyces paradoxus]|uniref:Pheromone-regulated protein PRM3 n=1 Tax=Saccharomyces paradoxus TaxID=27291 RepID=A0A8B8V0N6_SACPA|nr:Prm3 [Saccharomyces paradoxus]QHS76547.1 Prm3 [Saccharomyces paradoxus]
MSAVKKDNTAPNPLKRENDHAKSRTHKVTEASSKLADNFHINKSNNTELSSEKPSIDSKYHIKKAVSPGRVRKRKTTTFPTKSRPKSKKKDASESKTEKENKGTFYQGAIFGSFLGAAVTTVLSNLAVKALQN